MNTEVLVNKMTELSDEICFVYDVALGQLSYLNPAFEVITNRKRKLFLSSPIKLLKLVHEDDINYVTSGFGQLLKHGKNSLLNFRILSKGGSLRWIRLKVSAVEEQGNVAYLTGMAEDDTARKASIFNMQKVNGWKDANLEILSHDLRAPMGIVQLLTSQINKELPEKNRLYQLTKTIGDICQRNIELIQTLLKKEFLSTAKVQISKERLDVVWEVGQAMDIYLKSQKNIKKVFTVTQSHSQIYAEVDSMKFLQIINNLVSNAIKFTGDNGKIAVAVEKRKKSFLISVKDNGIGIPEKLRPILFDKYSRAGRKGLEGETSVGLGMWIVKTMTEAHGGRVWFETKTPIGSTFFVEIPLGSVIA